MLGLRNSERGKKLSSSSLVSCVPGRCPAWVCWDRVLAAGDGERWGGPLQVSIADQSFEACLHNTFGSTTEIRASPQLYLEALPQSLKPGARGGTCNVFSLW